MVPDVVEDGGKCTLTLTQGDVRQSVSGVSVPGRVSTYCDLLTYPVQKLARGEWQATLSYQSATRAGVSESRAVTAP